MSWWKNLLKIGGVAAAPFTGGASLIPTLIGTGLDVAGGLAKGRAQGRQAENAYNQGQDLFRLHAANFNRQAPGLRAGQSVRGDILANAQPFQLQGEGRTLSATGGLSPALFSAGTRQLGSDLSRQALLSQLGQGGPNDPYATLAATPMQKPGALDAILGGAGVAGNVLKLLHPVAGYNTDETTPSGY